MIASRGTPWSELEKRGAGFWVPNDPDSLAEAIGRAKAADLEALGRVGREWMKEAYGWPSIAERMVQVYRELALGVAAAG